MSASDVQSEILDPMQRLFLPPRNMDEGQQSAALREYCSALQNFAAADLSDAWRAVRDTHTTRGWPVPAAFILAAKQARKDRESRDRASRPASADQNPAWEGWKSVRGTQMARDAARIGVAWALKCAVLNDNKRPEEIDLRELRRGKDRAEFTAAKIQSGELEFKPGVAGTALAMWRQLLLREAETQQEINYRGTA